MQYSSGFKEDVTLIIARNRRRKVPRSLMSLALLAALVGVTPLFGFKFESVAQDIVSTGSDRPSGLISSGQSQGRPGGAGFSEEDDPETLIQPEDDGLLASVFSSTGLVVVFGLGILAVLVSRKVRGDESPEDGDRVLPRNRFDETDWLEDGLELNTTRHPQDQIPPPKVVGMANGSNKSANHSTVATTDSLSGAYRIDQEVGKLVLGQPHRTDVLSSRAPSDRRAIETSLVKMIRVSSDENEQRRAREAVEEYGFVARECASLLMADDSFERASAARALGDIKSPSALPFLLEALFDSESIVRNQAVESIGELRLPKAIGALLAMANQHPDVPATILSRALSACSVEDLDCFDSVPRSWLLGEESDNFFQEISQLKPPSTVEDLPEGTDDEELAKILLQIHSPDPAERAFATKTLAAYHVRASVSALSSRAHRDPEAAVRAQAISSLATINHESVFPAVLIGMADEAREVRAAAARSLSRLSFDRVNAYARLLQTADDELLREVASACIQAGIVSQGIDRLSSGDRCQAQETFSIVSLLAKAKLTNCLVEAISTHSNGDVRLAAVRLLGSIPQPELVEQLRELALNDDMSEVVRTALLKVLYKYDKENLRAVKPKTDGEKSIFQGDLVPALQTDTETESCSELENIA